MSLKTSKLMISTFNILFLSILIIIYWFVMRNGYLTGFWIRKTLLWSLVTIPIMLSIIIPILFYLVINVNIEKHTINLYFGIGQFMSWFIIMFIIIYLPEFYVGFKFSFQWGVLVTLTVFTLFVNSKIFIDIYHEKTHN